MEQAFLLEGLIGKSRRIRTVSGETESRFMFGVLRVIGRGQPLQHSQAGSVRYIALL